MEKLSEDITAYLCDAVKETPELFINKDGSPMTPFEALGAVFEKVAQLERKLEAVKRNRNKYLLRSANMERERNELAEALDHEKMCMASCEADNKKWYSKVDTRMLALEATEEQCKDLDWEAQELLKTGKEEDLNRASAFHYAIDKVRSVMPEWTVEDE